MFVNPLEILDLQSAEPSEIDNSIIKKAKRRLFAEIELSDQEDVTYKGMALSRSDCEEAIDALHDPGALSFYSYLLSNASLNDFLASGDEQSLHDFMVSGKLIDPQYLPRISAYFAASLNKAMLQFFKSRNIEMFRAALEAQALLEPSERHMTHEGINREIRDRISQVEQLTHQIRKGEVTATPAKDLVTDFFPADLMDILPEDFNGKINKVASAVNMLAIAVHETEPGSRYPDELYSWILQLNLDTATRTLMQENQQVVQEQGRLQRNGVCFFCNAPADEGFAVEVKMYKQTAIDGVRNTYQAILVTIGQCRNCMEISERSRRIFRNVFWGFTGSGMLLIAILLTQKHNKPAEQYMVVFILLLALLTVAFLAANSFKSKYLTKNRQKRRMSDIDLHWAVAANLSAGWTLSKPDKYGKLPED